MKTKMKSFNYILPAIIFFLASYSTSFSQWAIMKSDADSLVREGADHIYNVEFDEAEKDFEEIIKRYPDHPAGYFLNAMVDWWKITLYRNTDKYDRPFLKKIQKVIDVSQKLLDKDRFDITGLFFKGGALGYRARYYAIQKEWLSAAKDGKEAYDILQKSYELAPGNHDIMLGTGVYNYFAEAIPERYPLLSPMVLFLSKGDKELGLLQLRAAANHARYAPVEAKVTLLQIYYGFENNDPSTLAMAQELHDKYPKNPYFHRYLGRAYIRTGQWDMAEQVWREILKKRIAKVQGYDNLTAREAMYYIGTNLMARGENQMALKYLLKTAEASEYVDRDDEVSGFTVNAHLKIAKLYDRIGKRDKAKQYFKKVLTMDEYNDSHSTAKSYLKNLK